MLNYLVGNILKLSYLVFFLLVLLAGFMVFGERIFNNNPSTNTIEYLAHHGVKNGQKNIVSVKGVVYSIPPEIKINVFTYGDIVRGKADILTLYFDFSHFFKGDLAMHTRRNSVRVELKNMGMVEWPTQNLYKQSWRKIIEHHDSGLIEFQKKDISGISWGNVYYQTIDKLDNYPKSKILTFTCQGDLEVQHLCRTSVQYKNGISLGMFIPAKLMPHWRSIYNKIYTKVDSFNME